MAGHGFVRLVARGHKHTPLLCGEIKSPQLGIQRRRMSLVLVIELLVLGRENSRLAHRTITAPNIQVLVGAHGPVSAPFRGYAEFSSVICDVHAHRLIIDTANVGGGVLFHCLLFFCDVGSYVTLTLTLEHIGQVEGLVRF